MAKRLLKFPRLLACDFNIKATIKIRQLSVFFPSSKTYQFQQHHTVKTDLEPTRSVFISQSSDIFTNLALEDWMYRNLDFRNNHTLFFWCNSPTVVIGRHQNPWMETNTEFLENNKIALARRNSGGGTVYHDCGNLNCTFFTPRGKYNRKYNLELICRALEKEWGVNVGISPREDIILNGEYKISGTAAKLGQPNAYHHCTLLVSVNSYNLHSSLHKEENVKECRATPSIQSPVINLKDVEPTINVETLLCAVGREFLCTTSLGENQGDAFLKKQRGFQMVNPTNEWFPGLDELKNDFQSWKWIYGKTPKFTVTCSFPIPKQLATGNDSSDSKELTIEIQVNHGYIEDVNLKFPKEFNNGLADDVEVVSHLKGKKFSKEALHVFESIFLNGQTTDKYNKKQFVRNCFKKLVRSV